MKRFLLSLVVAGLSLALGNPLHGDEPYAKASYRELHDARRSGWQVALSIVETLESADLERSPGIRAWLKDFRKVAGGIDLKVAPEKWPAIDVDALVGRNPNFWQAYFEIAPGDPGLMALHAGLLLSAGESTRASHLIVVAGQRPGVPKEVQQGFEILLAQAQRVADKPNKLVQQGTDLHDKGDYAGALKKYQEALDLWPQNGFAHYEVGLSLYYRDLVAAGEKLPEAGAVIINEGRKQSPEVLAAYAKARRHDPFQFKAYQGSDQEVIRGLRALAKDGLPAWQKLAENPKKQVADEVLRQLGAACQEANIHELALAVRQVIVARRGRYDPADHPFITTSLRKLAPSPQTEEVLKLLASGKLEVKQLVAPEEPAADEPTVAELNQLRLYVPTPELAKRIGDDVEPLTNYIKALQKAASELLGKAEKPKAKGMLIAVGIKSGKKSRIWCQAVDGDIPEELLRKLEKELEKIETIELKRGPMAFGMEVKLHGQKVGQFPEFPAAWLEAAKKTEQKLLVPPDELFKTIWPD